VSTFVIRLKAPRPTFALDMTDAEREVMGRHAAYWQPFIESGVVTTATSEVEIGKMLAGFVRPR
jgi:hypothetical protein